MDLDKEIQRIEREVEIALGVVEGYLDIGTAGEVLKLAVLKAIVEKAMDKLEDHKEVIEKASKIIKNMIKVEIEGGESGEDN